MRDAVIPGKYYNDGTLRLYEQKREEYIINKSQKLLLVAVTSLFLGTTITPAFASSFVPYYATRTTFGTTSTTAVSSNQAAPQPIVTIPSGSTNVQTGTVSSATSSKFVPYGGYYTRWTTTPKPATSSTTTPPPVPAPTPTPTPVPTPVPAPTPAPVSNPVLNLDNLPSALSAKEQQMLNLINQERTSRGIKPLEADMRLVKAARMKSQDMITKNYNDHISPTYGSPFDMMKAMGISFNTAAENIAGTRTVEGAHTNLMNSSGHRSNILSPSFTKIGIGIIEGGPYGLMFTQMFIG